VVEKYAYIQLRVLPERFVKEVGAFLLGAFNST